jgi:hypothetical protein
LQEVKSDRKEWNTSDWKLTDAQWEALDALRFSTTDAEVFRHATAILMTAAYPAALRQAVQTPPQTLGFGFSVWSAARLVAYRER